MKSSLPDAPPDPLRIVLLGGGGLLGSAFRQAWRGDPRVRLIEFRRAELNLTQPDRIDDVLAGVEFDVLVNCAAYTAVDDAEAGGHDLAMTINGEAPGRLARSCATHGARMVHFSTDYVFDGLKGTPYTEEDPPHPINVYGESKLRGEILVRDAHAQHLIVRLAWLFGPGRKAFPEWVLDQALHHDEVHVVADKTGSPTLSTDAVRCVEALLFSGVETDLVHICHSPPCTWLEFGQQVLDVAAGCGVPLRTGTLTPVSIAELPGLTAQRPPCSALSTEKFARLTGVIPRPWREAVAEHVRTGIGLL